jgi:hypothetical protein
MARTGSPDCHRGLAGMVKPSRLARKKSIIEKNPLLKWGGFGLAALASVVVASVSGLLILGLWKLHARSAPPCP